MSDGVIAYRCGCLIAALTCGAAGGPKARRTSRQVKCLVPAQGDGTRPNEVSAAIPGDAVAGNQLLSERQGLQDIIRGALRTTKILDYLLNFILFH
jgi:hypothetical protein